MLRSNDDATVEVRQHATTTVLNMSGPRLNALSEVLVTGLDHAVSAALEREDLRCVVLTSAGKAFSAGANLDQLRAMNPTEQSAFNARLVETFNRIADLAVPTIAAVDGYALGGGLELALACTFRIASPSATLGLPESRLGVLPGAGGTQRLPRLIGTGPALRLLLTGATVTADAAKGLGLVDEVAVDPINTAINLADEIALSAPCAVRAIAKAVTENAHLPTTEAIERTTTDLAGLLATQDAAEGMAAFAAKRQPVWSNR